MPQTTYSTGAQSLPRRVRRPHRWAIWLVAGLVAATAIGVAGVRALHSPPTPAARPDLQQVLDGLVSGRQRVAPGASAYVVGPDGSWAGAAGLANVKTGEPMTAVTGWRTFEGVTIPASARAGWFYGTDRWPNGEFIRYHITNLHLVTAAGR